MSRGRWFCKKLWIEVFRVKILSLIKRISISTFYLYKLIVNYRVCQIKNSRENDTENHWNIKENLLILQWFRHLSDLYDFIFVQVTAREKIHIINKLKLSIPDTFWHNPYKLCLLHSFSIFSFPAKELLDPIA